MARYPLLASEVSNYKSTQRNAAQNAAAFDPFSPANAAAVDPDATPEQLALEETLLQVMSSLTALSNRSLPLRLCGVLIQLPHCV